MSESKGQKGTEEGENWQKKKKKEKKEKIEEKKKFLTFIAKFWKKNYKKNVSVLNTRIKIYKYMHPQR